MSEFEDSQIIPEQADPVGRSVFDFSSEEDSVGFRCRDENSASGNQPVSVAADGNGVGNRAGGSPPSGGNPPGVGSSRKPPGRRERQRPYRAAAKTVAAETRCRERFLAASQESSDADDIERTSARSENQSKRKVRKPSHRADRETVRRKHIVVTSDDSSDDEVRMLGHHGRRQSVRAEVHVPFEQPSRASHAVRFADRREDKYYTCVSSDEDGETSLCETATTAHSRRKQEGVGSRRGGESRRSSDDDSGSRSPQGHRRRRHGGPHDSSDARLRDRRSESGKRFPSSDRGDKCSVGRRSGKVVSRRGGESPGSSEEKHRPSHRHSRRDDGPHKKSAVKPHVRRRGRGSHSSSFDRDDRRSSSREASVARFSSRSRRKVANVKLGRYDGSTCLATFLAKFENCSQYYSWSEEDRLFQLKASLEGPAGQVLWDADQTNSTRNIVRLLRSRFGSEDQQARFRAELKVRRRRKGESLQSLYQDICRLVALAYPGPSSALLRIVGRDAFLDALDDAALRVRILEWEPKDLDEALQLASRFEAYGKTVYGASTDGVEVERERLRGRNVRAVNSGAKSADKDDALRDLTQKVAELQAVVLQCQKQLSQKPVSQVEGGVCPSGILANRPQPVSAAPAARQLPAETPPGRTDGVAAEALGTSQGCFACGQVGHFARSCPNRRGKGTERKDANVKHVAGPNHPAEVYLRAQLGHRTVNCLLDTGSERSLIGRRLIPDVELKPTSLKLYAANETEIPIVGCTELDLKLGELEVKADLIVTDNLEEIILGFDWLSQRDCQWDFSRNRIIIEGVQFPLQRRQTRAYVRRIYVGEEQVVPAKHQANVAVTMSRYNPYATSPSWVVEPKAVVPGVLVARTLLAEDAACTAVRVINYSDEPCRIEKDFCFGEAVPAEVLASGNGVNPSSGNPAGGSGGNRASENSACAKLYVARAEDPHEHLQSLFQSLPEDLTQEQRAKAEEFIRSNASLFSKSEFDIGRTDLVQHRIDTGSNRPFRQPLRRHPMSYLPTIDQHVDEMLRHDIVEPAASPWCSNVVLIRKSDGGLRFCIDYRQLNELTYKDSYPLPRIDMCLSSLGGSSFFSTLDLRAGYWQTLIHEEDRDKTCFVTRRGTFRFKVLSFGLANAPALFQRLMDLVLVGLTWEICLVYLDDVIVMSRSFDEQLERLKTVFDRFQAANLKLKPSKCKLFQKKVIFLGHLVSGDGIAPDPDKIRVVQEWPRPKNLTEARAFVGLASYYRNFVEGFAKVARPLHELTKKGRRFEWTERQEAAFIELKERLTEAPVLATPADSGTYWLDTDSSDFALGAVLQQEQDGVLRVIGYASRALSDAEKKYCTTRKEMLGVIFGLKQYRQFLLGRAEFVIRTDHAALTQLKRTPEPVGQQARWLDLLAEYNFRIQHRAGTAHRNCDALSRRPCERDSGAECSQCRPKRPTSCASMRQNVQEAETSSHENVFGVAFQSAESVSRTEGDVLGGGVSRARPASALSLDSDVLAGDVSRVKPAVTSLDPGFQWASDGAPALLAETGVDPHSGDLAPDAVVREPPDDGDVGDVPSGRVSDGEASLTGEQPQSASDGASTLLAATNVDLHSGVSAPDASDHVINVNAVTGGRESTTDDVTVGVDRPVFNDKHCIDEYSGSTALNPEKLREAQEADVDIAPILRWKVASQQRPSWNSTAKCTETTKNYCAQWNSLEVIDGILYRNFVTADGHVRYRQVVVPHDLRREFVSRSHGVMVGGHFGIRKTQEQFQRRGYFMYWKQYVDEFCKSCTVCAKFHRGKPPRNSFLKPIDCGAVHERWQCDLSGPYPMSHGNRYICVCVEAFTRYVVAVPIRDKTALSVARVLVREVVAKFGLFQSLQTDNGREFQNEILQHMCQMLHIDQLRITSYRPSSNGRCEIINRTLHSLLGKVVADNQRDWAEWLPLCVLAYNTSRHESTGMTPYFLMYSRQALTPLDLLLERPQGGCEMNYHEFVEQTECRMRYAYNLVQEYQSVQFSRMKRYYDVRVKPKTFQVNDLVYYYYPRKYAGRCPKWTRVYSGVYCVTKVINDVVYVIQKTPQSRPIIVNVDKLKMYCGDIPTCWRKRCRPDTVKEPPTASPATASGGTVQVSASDGPAARVSFPDGVSYAEDAVADAGRPPDRPAARVSFPGGVSYAEDAVADAGCPPDVPAARVSYPDDVSYAEDAVVDAGRPPDGPAARVSFPDGVSYAADAGKLSGRPANHVTPGDQAPATAAQRQRSQRQRRLPLRFRCCRESMEYRCPVCPFRYRTRGSCYKHCILKHGVKYRVGFPPLPIPPEELPGLVAMYQTSCRYDAQRVGRSKVRRSGGTSRRTSTYERVQPTSATADQVGPTLSRPHSEPSRQMAAQWEDTRTSTFANNSAQDEDSPFDLETEFNSSTERMADAILYGSEIPAPTVHVRAIRTAAPVELRHVECQATPATVDTAVEVTLRKSTVDVAIDATASPDRVDRAINPPTVDEIAAWQLPPAVDLIAIANLMVGRPELPYSALQQLAEQQLPHPDQSPYGVQSVRLALQAMRVYERSLMQTLHAVSTLGYSYDATGWMSHRQCAARLEALSNRPTHPADPTNPPPRSPSPPVSISDSD